MCSAGQYCGPGTTEPQVSNDWTSRIAIASVLVVVGLALILAYYQGVLQKLTFLRQLQQRFGYLLGLMTLASLIIDVATDIASYADMSSTVCTNAPVLKGEELHSAGEYDTWFNDWKHCDLQCNEDQCLALPRNNLSEQVSGPFLTVLVLVLLKEAVKAIVFVMGLMNSSTRNSPKMQYVARNVLAFPILLMCGGRRVYDLYYSPQSYEPVKLLVVDTLFEDLPQLYVQVQYMVLLGVAPGLITWVSFLLTSVAVLYACYSLAMKVLHVAMDARKNIQEGLAQKEPSHARSAITVECMQNPIARVAAKQALRWDTDQVCTWLQEVGFGERAAACKEAGIDGSGLLQLDGPAMEELGILSPLRRSRLRGEIAKLR